ncbi:DUF2470 domain-containing protein [Kineococcus halophytocola]|uniref:DUF2470 domain-containing protein n=1 Tax=Kineococcus halophytocola TaxID=3234027 RepID=UPI00351A081F
MPRTTTPGPARPTPAQWGRTLAAGTVTGTVHLPRPQRTCPHAEAPLAPAGLPRRGTAPRTQPFPVQHLTDAWGGLLLLVDDDSPLHARLSALRTEDHRPGVPVVLDVLDVPPGQAVLPRARLSVTGWAEAILPADQRRVAQTAAAVRPLGALLDVGTTRSVWRLEVADVRVTTAEGVHLVPEEEFTTATPDPLYEDEDGLVTHLEAAHRDALVGWVLDTLPPHEAQRTREVAVVGADRYGLDVLVTVGAGTTVLRASFTTPVRGAGDVAGALCGLFGCPCREDGRRTHESA